MCLDASSPCAEDKSDVCDVSLFLRLDLACLTDGLSAKFFFAELIDSILEASCLSAGSKAKKSYEISDLVCSIKP